MFLFMQGCMILFSLTFSAQNKDTIECRYIFGQDRVVFCDGQALGVRSDYNGVLLLDTILQKPVSSCREYVKLEFLLSEVNCLVDSV